jgi:hypothetical protein
MGEDNGSKIIDFNLERFHALCMNLLSRDSTIPAKAFGEAESVQKSAAEAMAIQLNIKIEGVLRASLAGSENSALPIPRSSEGENSED